MHLKINIKQFIGVLLIYFALIWNQTNVGEIYLKKYTIPIAILFVCLLFIKSRCMTKWCTLCYIVLFVFVVMLRSSVGGIGAEAFFNIVVLIAVSAYAIAYNKDEFLTRFLKVVVFLATISVILWVFCWFFPDIYKLITIQYNTNMTYKIYSTSTLYTEYSYGANGLFFYTMREIDQRNTGIFTEPGVYQMVINSALFILLMLDKYLHNISTKQKRWYFIILTVALITTQSTTGYIGGCLIFLFYIINSNNSIFADKKAIFTVLVLAVLGLVVDYHVREEASLLSVTVYEKLMNASNHLSLSADSSGTARLGAIYVALKSILTNPFGVGYDNFNILMNSNQTGYVAAAILSFGAVWGVLPLIFVLSWIFYPIIKSNIKNIYKLLFVLLYINTCLAQSSILYPSLILIPLYLYYEIRWHHLQNVSEG